jgi:hypothetical protein
LTTKPHDTDPAHTSALTALFTVTPSNRAAWYVTAPGKPKTTPTFTVGGTHVSPVIPIAHSAATDRRTDAHATPSLADDDGDDRLADDDGDDRRADDGETGATAGPEAASFRK